LLLAGAFPGITWRGSDSPVSSALEQVVFLPAFVTVQPEASLSLPPLINIKGLTLTQQHQPDG